MVLYLENKFEKEWMKKNNDIIAEFLKSDFYLNNSRELSVRLALFIASDNGYNSTFRENEFWPLLASVKDNLNGYMGCNN